MKKISWLITISMMVIMMSSIAVAGTVNIYPTDDAYTDSSKANTNINNMDLKIGYDLNHGKHRTYLKFDLSDLSEMEITGAKLNLDPLFPINDPTVNVYQTMSTSWSESTITWNNAPSHGADIIDSRVIDQVQRLDFDVTSTVLSAGNIVSFTLVSASETTPNKYAQFFSKDIEGEIYWPYLEVTFEGEVSCNTAADSDCDGFVSLGEYNDFKYGYKNGFLPDVTLTEYNNVKYAYKNGLLNS